MNFLCGDYVILKDLSSNEWFKSVRIPYHEILKTDFGMIVSINNQEMGDVIEIVWSDGVVSSHHNEGLKLLCRDGVIFESKKQPLKELRMNLLGKVFTVAIGAWLVGKLTNIKLRGSKSEIQAIANAMVASKAFQDELRKPGATIDSVAAKLNIKRMTADEVKRRFNIDWPL